MPGHIYGPDDWDDDTLFAAPKPPLERPHAAVSHTAPDTSRQAAQEALGRSGSQRRRIYELIVSHRGLTADEVCTLTEIGRAHV